MMKMPIYKKWWFLTIIISILLLTIIVPFVINESYKTGRGYITLWGASDVLAYFGIALSFAGTVILGALTFWQNEKLREANDKLLNLERKSKRGYFVPQHRVEANDYPVPVTAYHFLNNKRGIVLIGCGEDIILVKKAICTIKQKRNVENDYEIFITTDNEFKELLIPIKLNNAEIKKESVNMDVELHMENSRGYKYKQIVFLSFSKIDEHKQAYSVTGFNSKFEDME